METAAGEKDTQMEPTVNISTKVSAAVICPLCAHRLPDFSATEANPSHNHDPTDVRTNPNPILLRFRLLDVTGKTVT